MSHMNLNERIKIEGMLNQRCRKIQIAKELNRSLSTISREINKHRILKPHHPQKNDNYYNCKYYYFFVFNIITSPFESIISY